MWRTDKVKPAPDSLGRRCSTQNSPYKGKVTAYDNPIYIADAALYLKATQPELKIDNPYELDDKQFQAAVDLLKTAARDHRRVLVGLHQGAGRVRQRQLRGRHDLAGDREPARADKVPIKTTLPKEGATGWSDTWMISSKAKHPNCMYMWMNHIISPKANAAGGGVVRGGAVEREVVRARPPSRTTARSSTPTTRTTSTGSSYWTTPRKDCGDDRGAVCKDYSEWVQAWTEIKG